MKSLAGMAAMELADPGLAAGKKQTDHLVLRQYYSKDSAQLEQIFGNFRQAPIPTGCKRHNTPMIVLQALAARHMPQRAVVIAVSSADRILTRGTTAQYTDTLLETMPDPPGFATPATARRIPRVVELRTYHCPTCWQLKTLHERLSGSDTAVFQRAGVYPLFCSEICSNKPDPSLAYLIPFEDLAVRREAWIRISTDPEWKTLRRSGSVTEISLYRPIEYSPPPDV